MPDVKILAFQNPEFKILATLQDFRWKSFQLKILVKFKIFGDFKIFQSQNPEFKISALFKIFQSQNGNFKILGDLNIPGYLKTGVLKLVSLAH